MSLVAITGHTSGIGKAMADYFTARDYHVLGFSRSNGYDISKESDRQRIIDECQDADIFVSNAYNFKTDDDGQTLLLKAMTNNWYYQSKLIVNVSSIGGDFASNKVPYNINKANQDSHMKITSHTTTKLHTINLKPYWVSTDWVNASWPDIAKGSYNWPNIGKLDIEQVMKVFDFMFTNLDTMRITEISMYPKFNS
jgi:NAD(P)-dependent dehydrogenase (short-subunit alcohol dehydrogenase family)